MWRADAPKPRPRPRRRQGGFTIFEVVVVMCLIVLLYMQAEQRLNHLPAAAERAAFFGIMAQLKTGLNMAMINHLANGRAGDLFRMDGSNPMNYMLETPGNYDGEVASLAGLPLEGAHWYFERSSGELVYTVGEENRQDVRVQVSPGNAVALGRIRLRVVAQRGGAGGGLQGVLLSPVLPFEWESGDILPLDIDSGNEESESAVLRAVSEVSGRR